MNHKRVNAISAYEFFLCLFVIFIHISAEGVTYGNRIGLFSGILFFLNKSLSFVVPAFIFASALKLTLKYKDIRISPNYFVGRISKIYLPYLLWVAAYYVYFIVLHYLEYNLQDLVQYILTGTLAAHFYFVVIIMQFYILMPLFLFIAKKIPALAGLVGSFFLTIGYVFFSFTNPSIFNVLPGDRWFLGYLIFWMTGVYYALHFEAVTTFARRNKMIVLLPCAILLLTHVALSYASYIGIYMYNPYFAQTMHLLFCIVTSCGFYLACLFCTEPFRNFFRNVGATTYYVYLSHLLVMFAVERFLLKPHFWLAHRFLIKALFVYCIPFVGAYLYILFKKRVGRFMSHKNNVKAEAI